MWHYLQIFFLAKRELQTRGGTPPPPQGTPLFVVKTHNIVFDPFQQQQRVHKECCHSIGDSVLGQDSERVKS